MKSIYADIMETIQLGNPHKFILQDGSTISFMKKGRDKYKMVLKDKNGTKKDTRVLRESGLKFMFEEFSDKASYVNVRKGE